MQTASEDGKLLNEGFISKPFSFKLDPDYTYMVNLYKQVVFATENI